jgi:hypothetical protein
MSALNSAVQEFEQSGVMNVPDATLKYGNRQGKAGRNNLGMNMNKAGVLGFRVWPYNARGYPL